VSGPHDEPEVRAGTDEAPAAPATDDGVTEEASGPAPDGAAAEEPDPTSDGAAAEAPEPHDDAEPVPDLALAGDGAAVGPTGDAVLEAVRREREEYLDALRRLQADFENYKKRVAKQQADFAARAAEALVEKLLPALDVADLAIAHGGGEEVKQIWTALLEPLEREGLERIDPAGGPFDPTRHDAVAHEPGEGDEGPQVAEVLRAGYAWKGRVLRAAMVKVRG